MRGKPILHHIFHPSILRAYDIRGRVDETLTCQDAEYLGRSFGTMIIRAGGRRVSVARDGRLTSPALSEALINGLLSTGVDVVDIGCGPTPMLYYSVFELEVDGGIMVTGSHNPVGDNGFKLLRGQSALHGDHIQALGRLAAKGDFETGQGQCHRQDISHRYLHRLLADVDIPVLKKRNLKIGWDPGHGAGAEIINQLVKHLPGQHFVLNGTIDGTFPAHHPDPTVPENLEQLKELVQQEKLDLGFAFDGDADRIGMVDTAGNIIWGDHLTMLLAEDILQHTPGATIIADVKSSQVFFDKITELGGISLMWKTGHSLIKEKMQQTGAVLAGEISGHIYIKDQFYGFDDGIYVALRLLNCFSGHAAGVMSLLSQFPLLPATPEIRFPCSEAKKFDIIPEVLSRIRKEGHHISTVDGIRVSTNKGWWLLRPSNTQAALVARCEALEESDLSDLMDHLNHHLALCGLAPVTFMPCESDLV